MEIGKSDPNLASANRAALVKQARVWVSQTFFGTLLKQMHDSPFRSELFSGGRGGQAFSSLFDQHLTERIAGGKSAEKLVNSIVKHIERAQETGPVPVSRRVLETGTGPVLPYVAPAPRD
jgi:Rod binding domain-containing protein